MRRMAAAFAAICAFGCSRETSPPPSATTTATASASVAPTASATPARAPAPSTDPVRVAFVGDVCMSLSVGTNLDRMREGAEVPDTVKKGYPFLHVVERLREADVLVGNLECVLSLRGERSTDHNPFRCTMQSPEVLKAAGFDLVSIANNHAMDYGLPAFRDMLNNLDDAGLAHFGQETFTRKPQAPVVHTLRGLKIGLLAYYWPPDLPLVDVHAARKKVDVLFVFMHWGMDDVAEPMELQRRLGRDFIEAGADVVVGTHSHVLQPVDWYQGKLIAYGLGNFVFSGMMHTEAHRTGAMLEIDIHSDRELEFRMPRIRLEPDGAPKWLDDPKSTSPCDPRNEKNLLRVRQSRGPPALPTEVEDLLGDSKWQLSWQEVEVSMRSQTARSLVVIALATGTTGCATVKPWERGRLAKPCMQLDPKPESTLIEQHVYQYREGSAGGYGGLGGGCGCN